MSSLKQWKIHILVFKINFATRVRDPPPSLRNQLTTKFTLFLKIIAQPANQNGYKLDRNVPLVELNRMIQITTFFDQKWWRGRVICT